MKIIAYLLTILLLSSCLKRKQTQVNKACKDSCMTFNVRVGTDDKSSTPVKDANVELSWSNPCGASPFCDYGRLIATGKTNNSGVVVFSFKAEKKELKVGQFSVSIKYNPDGFQPFVSHYNITKFDSVVISRIHLPSKATIKLIFKDFHPTSTADYFSVNPYYANYGSDNLGIRLNNIAGGSPNAYFPGDIPGFTKIELVGMTAGNQYTYFKILRKKNGIRQDLVDSIYIQKGETKTYEIQY